MISPAVFHAGPIDVAIPDSAVIAIEREAVIAEALFARYTAQEIAFAVCEIVSERVETGTWHYRTRAGKLLWALDQVIDAILGNDLM